MLVGTALPGLMLTILGNQAFIQQTFKMLIEKSTTCQAGGEELGVPRGAEPCCPLTLRSYRKGRPKANSSKTDCKERDIRRLSKSDQGWGHNPKVPALLSKCQGLESTSGTIGGRRGGR